MEVDIKARDLPEKVRKSNEFKAGTDIDVKVDGKITVNGKTMDSPAIESKNIGPNLPPSLRESQQIEPLTEKLSTIGSSGENEIIVVVRQEYINSLDKKTINEVENDVNKALDKIQTGNVPDEVDIEFITFRDMRE